MLDPFLSCSNNFGVPLMDKQKLFREFFDFAEIFAYFAVTVINDSAFSIPWGISWNLQRFKVRAIDGYSKMNLGQ